MNIDIPDLLRVLKVDERVDETGGKVVQGECETVSARWFFRGPAAVCVDA